jgi:hypothetical protein
MGLCEDRLRAPLRPLRRELLPALELALREAGLEPAGSGAGPGAASPERVAGREGRLVP